MVLGLPRPRRRNAEVGKHIDAVVLPGAGAVGVGVLRYDQALDQPLEAFAGHRRHQDCLQEAIRIGQGHTAIQVEATRRKGRWPEEKRSRPLRELAALRRSLVRSGS
jgi:hypothetical protein